MHTDVVKYNIEINELPAILADVRKCTCRYWQDKELFTRMTMVFENVHGSIHNDIFRIDFSTKDDPSALSITGVVQSASVATDGEFLDVSILYCDNTEIHIFLHKL